MYQLASKPGPEWKELIPAIGDRPAVRVLFAPVGPKALRQARAAVGAVYRASGGTSPDVIDDAGDAFSAALIRAGILDWEGIGDENDQPVKPTHDREVRDPETGEVLEIQPGTITAFLAEPRLVEAADREYVLPWTHTDAEKNGFALSLNGISAGATEDSDTATSPAQQEPKVAAKPAPTSSTNRKRMRAKRSGG
jgi:hypothetical protein